MKLKHQPIKIIIISFFILYAFKYYITFIPTYMVLIFALFCIIASFCIYVELFYIIYQLRVFREIRRLHPINVKRLRIFLWIASAWNG